ncbi:hypothetical protein JL722_2203 [Aureococcus anophagefferens]|nr:hypothetical protein JL722_2203 [Aureococcus anophagefferens]
METLDEAAASIEHEAPPIISEHEAPPLLIDNARCFDCDASAKADPWVSLNHGTYLCINCAGVHRSLGVHISYVRSLNLDAVTAAERAKLERGGNAAFAAFLEAQGLPRRAWLSLEPIALRYYAPVADLYRRRLAGDARARLRDVDPAPDIAPPARARRPGRPTRPARTASSAARPSRSCSGGGTTAGAAGGDCTPAECRRPIRGELARHCKLCVPPVARPI